MLAIAGDSAAGKTTITGGLAAVLGKDRVTAVGTDDYHKYDRVQRKELDITPLHPECNYMDIIGQHLRLLSDGEPVLKPVYNHSTGTFDPPEYVEPKEFVIVEGLLPLYEKSMQKSFDVMVYLDPPEELRHQWKIKRDTAKRGYTKEGVLKDLEKREPDSETFIRPQRADADVIVRFYPSENLEDSRHLNVQLILRPRIPHPDFTEFEEEDNGSGIHFYLSRDMGKPVDVLEIDGNIDPDAAKQVEHKLWSRINLPEEERASAIGAFVEGAGGKQRSEPLALTQLLLVYHLLQVRSRREEYR